VAPREASPCRRLVSVALILTSRWAGVTCYAALWSPDVPPVACATSDRPAGFAGRNFGDARGDSQAPRLVLRSTLSFSLPQRAQRTQRKPWHMRGVFVPLRPPRSPR